MTLRPSLAPISPASVNRLFVVTPLVAAFMLLGACGEKPTPPTDQATVASSSSSASSIAIETTRIAPDEANADAKSIEQQVPITTSEGLKTELWASEKLLGDTVAIHVDDKGRVWAGITQRSNNSEFDIRSVPEWEDATMTFSTYEDRRKFLRSELAPEKSAQNEKIPDRNKDGSHDWRDLAVMTEKVIRLEDTQGSGKADFAQTVVNDFHTEVTDVIGGLFYNDLLDELFINIAPDVWRVKDTNGDGYMDSHTSLTNGFGVHVGFSGHGLSGAIMGPDGMLYSSMGDIGTSITDQYGTKLHYPNQGVIVRSEVDGSNLEVFAAGLRNIYELSFDKYGNLISVDNDGDHIGEYERVVHLIDGSDTGWRINWQLGKYKDAKNNSYKIWMDEDYYKPRFKNQAAHILPPVAPYHAGPTGMTYYPGTGLTDEWKDHFFVVEFVGSATRAGINAFTLKPKGASFELASDKNMMRGVLATGLDFGPDGALYFSDWIEGWGLKQKGRVWKMDSAAGMTPEREQIKTLLGSNFREFTTEQLVEHLNNADMRVRQKAQFVLAEQHQVKALQEVAVTSPHQLARIHAIWGLGQLLRQNPAGNAIIINLLQDSDPEIRAQAAKVLGDAKMKTASEPLIALLADKNPRVQLYAAQALGRMAEKNALQPLIDMLVTNNDDDVYLRQAGAIALARIGDADALGKLSTHSSEAVRVAAVVALKRMHSPVVAEFLNDSSEYVVTNAARAINDDELITDALPALAALVEKPRFTSEALLRRAINANVYAEDSDENAERLIRFATNPSIPGQLRAEAIAAVTVWDSGSVYDRVSGFYRGPINHPRAEAEDAFANTIETLLSDKSSEVRQAATNAQSEFNLQSGAAPLVKMLQQDTDPNVRISALHALKKNGHADIGSLVFGALKDKEQNVRMAALAMVPELQMPVAQVVEMHQLLIANGTPGEQQAALLSLANVKAPEAEAVFRTQMQQLIEGKIAPEVQLELITAAEQIGSPELKQLLADYDAKKDKNNPLEVYREAIYGGDAQKGMALFRYSNSTQCVRCHMVGHRGNKVGPDLTTIATRIVPEQMVEALVAPAARIAPGFGRVTVVMKNGKRVEGSFDAETKADVRITSDNKPQTILRSDIEKLEFGGISPMPPMGLGLTKAEIRDLVAYLSTLKEEVHEGH
ncbi:heme-binding protein [Cellvibrio sp. KY-GH-1]|uniref:HEAT repeat domain-containing protein n=1 Tax=Cellvibrio sp. KY-GH-1 TaxID=2303332 RepID=UPI001248485D|nr:HEAT repeat domain-containing protein [Cellvibrio sp. KY-GH-1]QEY15115.1 heme-binding protein [Cellvibrio sp. KY-GH-1]